jgi:hypothetical protein
MVAFIHLSLTMYEIRLKTVLKRIELHDYVRVQMLLDKYAVQPDIHILPEDVDDNIEYMMFMANIYCVVGQYEACKEQVEMALGYLRAYRKQQLVMISRLRHWNLEDDSLGSLAKLPWDCRDMIGEAVHSALFL